MRTLGDLREALRRNAGADAAQRLSRQVRGKGGAHQRGDRDGAPAVLGQQLPPALRGPCGATQPLLDSSVLVCGSQTLSS